VSDDGYYDREMIWDNALVPAPMGTVGSGMDPYNNAVVYFFAFFGLFLVPFGVVAIGIAAYRITRHRTHAVRGLVVALIATVVGAVVLVAAVSQA